VQKILIVEGSKFISSIARAKIESELMYTVHTAASFSEAKKLVESGESEYLACLSGLMLQDAPYGEIIDYMVSTGIPTIVFTGNVSEEVRDSVWSKKVVDYVTKDDIRNLDYIVSLLRRIENNRNTGIIIVDDSMSFRTRMANLLKVHQYRVLEARNGREALNFLEKERGIRMIITDYNMPDMDGLHLLKEIRSRFSRDELAVLGVSSDSLVAAKFLKYGANDFISKSFFIEEFYCRVSQNMDMLEQIARIRDASNIDFLTGLNNRRYFKEVGEKLLENAIRQNLSLTLAILDIDFFKTVNDLYGHDIGDLVLKKIGDTLKSRFRSSEMVIRLGGEEFCIMAINMDRYSIVPVFEKLRKCIEDLDIQAGDRTVKITASIGVCTHIRESLDEMIKVADTLLYEAKEKGRNRVVAES
jgi:diguanylate cyclase (GGDEF)-like protein